MTKRKSYWKCCRCQELFKVMVSTVLENGLEAELEERPPNNTKPMGVSRILCKVQIDVKQGDILGAIGCNS